MAFDESKVSRRPKGSADGGQFTTHGGGRNGDDDIRPPDPFAQWDEPDLDAMGAEQERILEDACREHRPLDDYEIASRREYVRQIIRAYHDQDTKTMLRQPNGEYPDHRKRQHQEIIDGILRDAHERNVGRHGYALMSGGLGGAGKSTILDSDDFKSRVPNFDRNHWLTLNNDDIKEEMARRGMIPRLRGLTPMECCFLIHEEASDILKDLRGRALREHLDVIMDGTMNGLDSTERRIRDLQSHGYKVNAVFVDISPETSKQRADGRYRGGMDRYTLSGGKGIGGRYLPSNVVDGQQPSGSRHRSRNAENIIALAGKGLFLHDPIIYDNDIDGMPARRIPFGLFARE